MKDSHLGDALFGEEPDEDAAAAGRRERADQPEDRHRLPTARPPATRAAARRRAERQAAASEASIDRSEPAGPPSSRARRWLPIGLALALVVGGGAAAVSSLGLSIPSINLGSEEGGDYAGEGEGSAQVRVQRGDSGLQIGSRLEQAGVVKAGSTFAAAFASDPKAATLQPGTYTLRKRMSSAAALALMLSPTSRTAAGITIPEGLWAAEVYARLSKATGTPIADYRKVKPAELGLPAAARGRVEGYLFPSTYEFDDGASAKTQLARMVAEFKRQVAPLKISPNRLARVVTVASIVQGESRLGPDGPKVARVVENRLRPGGETAGRLQMDSTVHFVSQKRGTVTTTAAERSSRSPYNTYLRAGLPPGPINSPGVAAIKAAAAPAKGPWMYFVTINQTTGETRFATSGTEHAKNVGLFQAWCRANPGKC